MNIFEKALAGYIGEENLMRLQKVKIGIAGAGGLGSNCAFNLVRSGFKKIKIVDFDCVEASNLDRQFYFYDQLGMPKIEALRMNLERINPGLELVTVQKKLTYENILESFCDCDVVIEAFDRAECKTMLVESYHSSGKLLVCASGLGGWGKSDEIKVHRVHPKFFVIGDMVSEAGEGLPPISPRVNIVAAKQADVVLSYVVGGMQREEFSRYSLEKDFYRYNCGSKKRRKLETGLYCLTASEYSRGRSNTEVVRAMLDAGVKLIQYREKEKKLSEKYAECTTLREMTANAGAIFIVNDHADLAMMVGADGIHLGQDDLPLEKVRELVGEEMIIGLSTHSPEQAQDAVRRGADYIGVGPIFRTFTKKDVCGPVGVEYLEYVIKNIDIPFVAIGGIKESNMHEVLARGASCIAMVTEIVGAEDISGKINAVKRKLSS